MHHPLAAVFWLAVMVFLVATMVAKRPHKVWMKTTLFGLLMLLAGLSIWGLARIDVREGIAAAVMAILLVWRTIKGWPEWWAKL